MESSSVLCCLPAIAVAAPACESAEPTAAPCVGTPIVLTDVPAVEQRAACADRPSEPSLDRQARVWERQAEARQAERHRRKRAVAFSRWAQQRHMTLDAAARLLDVSTRSLCRWRHGWKTDRLAARPRGRPCLCAPPELRQGVVDFLDATGPGTGLPTLKRHYPQVARSELVDLLTDYRGDWRAAHARLEARLHWLRAGSVWAIDFAHPPHAIDGCFPAMFGVRDLASGQQLLWLPVEDETADTAVDALHDLFLEHGAPLVLKCDNGPGFTAQATQRFLKDGSVAILYSPPYAPWYNGAIERANRSLKDITQFLAERAGHAGYWTSADLHAARLQLNRLDRSCWSTGEAAEGLTPEEAWHVRRPLTMDERDVLFENLNAARRALCREREIDPDAILAHHLESELIRLALQPVLENLGYLYVTRRRITPALNRRNCDRIT